MWSEKPVEDCIRRGLNPGQLGGSPTLYRPSYLDLVQATWTWITKDKTQEQFSKTSEKETHNTETAKKSSGKSTVLKINKKSHITRIPKIGCDIPFLVTLFTSLSNTEPVTMDERGIMSAVNIVTRAKRDLDEGKKWNGTIEINENLKLKLYKSGLGLYHKK